MSNERHVFERKQMYYGKNHDGKAVIYKVSTIARKSGFITFRKMLNNCKPSKEKFREGMVVTVEPGSYKDFGVRIEDMILVGKKPRVLTITKK